MFYKEKKALDTNRRVAVFIKRIYKTTPAFSWNIPIFAPSKEMASLKYYGKGG